MKYKYLIPGLWVFGAAMCAAEPIELNLASPEGTHHVRFYETKSASGANKLCYEVNYNGKQVIKESQAGLQLDNRVWEMALGVRALKQPQCWMDNLEVDSVAYGSMIQHGHHCMGNVVWFVTITSGVRYICLKRMVRIIV